MSSPRRRWLDMRLRRKGLAVVALPIIGLCLATGAFVAADSANRATTRSMDRNRAVRAQLRLVLGLVVDAETGARGFLLSREDRFLRPYMYARQALPSAVDRLSSLLDEPAQRSNLSLLRPLIDRRLQLSEAMGTLPPAAVPSDPMVVRLLDEGQSVTDAIRAQVSAMEATQTHPLQAVRSRARLAGLLGWEAVIAGVALGLAGGIGGNALFTRGIASRVTSLGRCAELLADGQPVGVTPPGADEIGQLGVALVEAGELLRQREETQQAARKAAEEANRSKSEFLSRMSHELRTPLNAVIGFAQLLEFDDLAPDQRESVDQILKGGRHLLNLIDEVLDISRIETGRLNLSPEPVMVAEVFTAAVELVRPLASASNVHFADARVADGLHVLADRQRLTQILLNLLSNAVKYNRPGGTIRLACEPAHAGCLRIDVTDSGPGIRAQDLPLLFAPFERLGAEQSQVEGTGIGLALSRHLAEAMGGSLDVTTIVGQGSTFSLLLPEAEGPVERYERLTGDLIAVPFPRRRGTVLHIEDNLSNLKLVERIFAREGTTQVVAAMQGRLGIELAREHRPRLVLLDLHLPDMGGDEVLRQLRQDPVTRSIPVVIVSADATRGEISRLLAAGAAGYITKPIDVPELLRVLDDVIGDPRSSRSGNDSLTASQGLGGRDGNSS